MSECEKLGIDATPIQICGAAIDRLSDFWDEVTTRTGHGHGAFIEEIFGGIWRDGDTGEKFEAEFERWDEQPEDMQPFGILQAAFVCSAYACQAIRAQKDNDMTTAWNYTARCKYWLGIVVGTWSIRSLQDEPMKEFARNGAAARHAENRAMKQDVCAWLDANMPDFKSMDSAAEAIAGKVAPVKFRTARDWVGEWKKLRSAGTP
ncbi:hypothetical protein LP416_29305 [Polaromonas sp. P2-4]|nr:hypothetical protein LP416_29305 [Polaromonas sp. P2-4]